VCRCVVIDGAGLRKLHRYHRETARVSRALGGMPAIIDAAGL
jgi:hypothetical protein